MANSEKEHRQPSAEDGKPGVSQAGIGDAQALVFAAPEVESPGVFAEGVDHSSPIVLQGAAAGQGTFAAGCGGNDALDIQYVTVQNTNCSVS